MRIWAKTRAQRRTTVWSKHLQLSWMARGTLGAMIFTIGAIAGLAASELLVGGQEKGEAAATGPEDKAMSLQTGFYCNIKALSPAERQRQKELGQVLRAANLETKELADGYAFRLRSEVASLADLAEWVTNERKCCPFFDFDIGLERDGGPLWLKLRGNEGVKAFIRNEFGLAPAQAEKPAARPATRSRESEAIDYWVTQEEKKLVDVADAMPADKYQFAPIDGEFKGVRTFGQQVKHLSATNYILGARILGEQPPADAGDETGPDSVRTKAEIMEYLKGSFAYFHKAVAAIDEQNSVIEGSPISPLPKGKATRLGLAVETLIHGYDHYGQLVEYLRMNGIVPPASR